MGNKKVTAQEVIADIGNTLSKVTIVLENHEQRLQLIEDSDVMIELKLLNDRITAIYDPKKHNEALQAFKNLCNKLGVSDLELTQP